MYINLTMFVVMITVFLLRKDVPLSLSLCRGRDRYINEEFDLDLTYITERIIGKSHRATCTSYNVLLHSLQDI